MLQYIKNIILIKKALRLHQLFQHTHKYNLIMKV